ncbi:response regulator transcription factor [Thalassotalea euphylliae]|uniref:Response regulator n=1 Tax=Thalassotalea euphylliae TaxID=1655234 RepID=A0A3E0UGI0_9GAMM|nr:response regulator [Thalassotalea euphylliae]REL36009.1 response regulator [Thalassotalea euphylliae]
MANITPSELSILLIEPSDTQRKIIVGELEKAGITQITTANNVAESIAIVDRHPPDLITSAMYFDDGTALDVLKHIKTSHKHADIAFMLVSSEYKKESLEEFKQSGVVALLPKPFTPEHLSAAINTTIDLLSPDEMELDYFDVNDIRVLLVDDSTLARNHIRRVLNNLGLQKVTEAEDGKQAIGILEDNMFDIVVTDYNMPEVDGRELTKYIREQSQQSHLPVLMVTSESSETHLANIEQDGVNALCDKPFEPQFVKQLLFQLLQQ